MRGRVDVATGAASFVCRNSVYQMRLPKWSPDPTRIDIHADHGLRYWSETFGVPKDEIVAASRVEDAAPKVSLLYA
jgi:hypothetical protein